MGEKLLICIVLITFIIFLGLIIIVDIDSLMYTPVLANNATFLNITTYDGSGKIVHPDVIFSDTGWNGYNYIMFMTPYPNEDSHYENPSMRVSNDGIIWTMLSNQTDPIIESPQNGFYSDPSGEFVGDTLYLFYRWCDSNNITSSFIYYISTTDGVTWTTPVMITMPWYILSPTFIYNGTGWECWAHNVTTQNLQYFVSANISYFANEDNVEVPLPPGCIQWHSEIRKYNTTYYLLLNTGATKFAFLNHNIYPPYNPYSRALLFYQSTDGLLWSKITSGPLLSKNLAGGWDSTALYKSSFLIIDNEFKLWYNGIEGNSFHVGYISIPLTTNTLRLEKF